MEVRIEFLKDIVQNGKFSVSAILGQSPSIGPGFVFTLGFSFWPNHKKTMVVFFPDCTYEILGLVSHFLSPSEIMRLSLCCKQTNMWLQVCAVASNCFEDIRAEILAQLTTEMLALSLDLDLLCLTLGSKMIFGSQSARTFLMDSKQRHGRGVEGRG
jgi:hypothetical protein